MRAAVALPVLRKDFTIDEVQVYETRAIGADAILLILAALPDDAVVRDLQDLAWSLGLAVLVEAHDEAELERGARRSAPGSSGSTPATCRRSTSTSTLVARSRGAHPAPR